MVGWGRIQLKQVNISKNSLFSYKYLKAMKFSGAQPERTRYQGMVAYKAYN